MNLNNKLQSDIKDHAMREYPNECCGLVIEEGNKLKAIKCQNISYNKEELFEISAIDYLCASKLGKIKAYYHSHPGESIDFSGADKQVSDTNGLPLIMYSIKLNEFKTH